MSELSIMEKFSSVEIKQDAIISYDDRKFCEAHQEAYEASLKAHKDMQIFYTDAIKKQTELLSPVEDSKYANTFYILANEIKIDTFQNLHKAFISNVAGYFKQTYNVSLETYDIIENLLPKNPESGWRYNKEEWAAWNKNIMSIILKYEDIVAQIREQLGGFSFAEKAVIELKSNCRRMAWGGYNNSTCYAALKGDTIQFNSWMVEYRDWGAPYRINSSSEALFKGLMHYEHGYFELSNEISRLIWDGSHSQTKELISLNKVKQLKFFKNGRLDIKFHKAADAIFFAENYLDL